MKTLFYLNLSIFSTLAPLLFLFSLCLSSSFHAPLRSSSLFMLSPLSLRRLHPPHYSSPTRLHPDVDLHISLPPTSFHFAPVYIFPTVRQFMEMSCQHLSDTPSGVEGELLLFLCFCLSRCGGRKLCLSLCLSTLLLRRGNLTMQISTRHIRKCICRNSQTYMCVHLHLMNKVQYIVAFEVTIHLQTTCSARSLFALHVEEPKCINLTNIQINRSRQTRR